MNKLRTSPASTLVLRFLSAASFFGAVSLYLGGLRTAYLPGLCLLFASHFVISAFVVAVSKPGAAFVPVVLGASDTIVTVAILGFAPPALPLMPALLGAVLLGHAASDDRARLSYVYFLSVFLYLGALVLWRERYPFSVSEIGGQALLFATLWAAFGWTFYGLYARRRLEKKDAQQVDRLRSLLETLNARWIAPREKIREAARVIGEELSNDASACRVVVHGAGHLLPPESRGSEQRALNAGGQRVGTLILRKNAKRSERDQRFLDAVAGSLAFFLANDHFWTRLEKRLDRFEASLLLGELKQAQSDASYLDGLKPVLAFARGAREFRSDRVNFSDILWAAVERVRPMAERRGLILAVEDDGINPAMDGDRTALIRVLTTLISAAGTAAPEGSGLRIFYRSEGEELILSIRWLGEAAALEPSGESEWESAFHKTVLIEHGGRVWSERSPETGNQVLNLALRARSAEVRPA